MQSGALEAGQMNGQQMDTIVRRFERPLLQYATRILGDNDRARDVVQETFVKLQKEQRGQIDEVPAKWLFTVCRNGALNICRKEKRMTYLDHELLEARPSEQPAPFENLEQKETSGFLLKILGTLPPRQQELLQLKFQNDLSYQEISEITQLSVSNVGVTIHNALKTLRQRYGQASRDFLPFTPRTAS
jgi:RNA polymerase sigma factor (sigma-70 family)